MGKSHRGIAFIEPTDFSHERQENPDWREAQAPEEVVQEVPG